MKTKLLCRLHSIRQTFHDPPDACKDWFRFALVITGLRLLLSRPEALLPLPILNVLLMPLCCWAAIPLTLVRLERRSPDYFKNTALLGLGAAIAAGISYIHVFQANAMTASVLTGYLAALLGTGLGIAVANAMLSILLRYQAKHSGRA